MEMKYSKRYLLLQKLIRFLGILLVIATGLLIIWLYRIGILNDSNMLKAVVVKYEVLGPLIFIVVQIIQVVFPVIPGGVTTVIGFLVFGWWRGFIYNYIGIIIGSFILFLLVKKFGRKFILLFVKEDTFYSYEKRLESKGFENFFILSMVAPFAPADVMVMITALTNMSVKRFLLIIMLAKPFSIVAYSAILIYGGDWAQKWF
ncbi:TVP38/TMEM64 family protein [Streptococcus pluranimalium]|uniref:TVP38/TMEM64 family protein n=1 Tax=Streptococcus hyovaginalis TaxID=149015 RepID=UPI0014785456|nr:VTT domain-containing protein [Streptococcus hyovaginalis]